MATQKTTIGKNRTFTCPHCQAEISSIIIEQKNRSVFYEYHFPNAHWEEMQEIGDAPYDIYRCTECDEEIGSDDLAKQGFGVI